MSATGKQPFPRIDLNSVLHMPSFAPGHGGGKTPYKYTLESGERVDQTLGYTLFVALNVVPQNRETPDHGDMFKRHKFQKRLLSALEGDGMLEVSPSDVAFLSEKVKQAFRDPWMIGQVVEMLGDSPVEPE